jgi:glycerophosphoryl diester phosphodiesterase
MGFAHRGLHSGLAVPENTLPAFAAALEVGAGIECDLRLTADNRIVVFHDVNAHRLCSHPAVIGRSILAELSELRVGSHPIPLLEDLLGIVAARVPLLLEIKVASDLRRWAEPLRRALAGYGGAFGIMSFEPLLLRLLKAEVPQWRTGLVVADSVPLWKRRLALSLARPAFLAVETAAAARPWVEAQRTVKPVYSWTVRSPTEREALSDRVDALIWESNGRP